MEKEGASTFVLCRFLVGKMARMMKDPIPVPSIKTQSTYKVLIVKIHRCYHVSYHVSYRVLVTEETTGETDAMTYTNDNGISPVNI